MLRHIHNCEATFLVDDLIELSGKTDPNEYLKFILTQQIADRRGFIARMGPEVNITRNELGQLNALIAGLEALEDVGEVWDTIMCLRDEQRKPKAKLADLQHWLTDVEEENVEKQKAVKVKRRGWVRRYFDVDLTVRKLVMNRLGQLLRNFRRKLRQTYILPNQNTLSKLNEVPTKYSAILKAEEWVNFVKYTATEEYKVKSAAAKMARSKSVYQHTMGRGGYALVKEKMKETEDKIKEGTLKVDHGTDAMTFVLGKEKEDYARGVGNGVTYKRYFDLPRSRQASDERILLLQSQLDNERRERQEKELLIQNLSNKMSQTEGMVTTLKNQLAAQGGSFSQCQLN
ncbi:hypothetical protein Tco_1492404 [Tanacetum coccineum]